jgi:hypothetical protein
LVYTTADSGAGSLRDAVAAANAAQGATATILFDGSLSGQTLTLTYGQIAINGALSIDASALPGGFTISGNHSNRIFEVNGGATVTLNSLSLLNGYAATGAGGGIGNSGGVVVVNNCILSGNTAGGAGAIENNNGTLTINASTLSANVSTGNGGAIDNDGGTLRANNSTFSGNSASGGGGGIENYGGTAILNNSTLSANSAGGAGGINNYGTLVLTNTIVAGNIAPFLPDLNLDSSGSFTGANNLTNGNPMLAPLGNYGGPTLTIRRCSVPRRLITAWIRSPIFSRRISAASRADPVLVSTSAQWKPSGRRRAIRRC